MRSLGAAPGHAGQVGIVGVGVGVAAQRVSYPFRILVKMRECCVIREWRATVKASQ